MYAFFITGNSGFNENLKSCGNPWSVWGIFPQDGERKRLKFIFGMRGIIFLIH